MAGAVEQPAVLTFLMTDIEGSTRLWSQHEDVMADVILRHDALVSEAVERHHGQLVRSKGEGDSTFSVFGNPAHALAASVDLQLALGGEPWPRGIELRTRAAIHTGEVQIRDGEYFGSTLNRCARLRSIGHGGQVICSQATAELLTDQLPEELTLRDLGTHGLRDLSRPEQVFQACHPALPEAFPALASLGAAHSNLPAFRSRFFGAEHELDVVTALLEDHRIVTLTGVGGCGKTRLAVEAASRVLDAYDGVFFCDLSPIADPEVVPVELARAVGLVRGSALGPTGTSVRNDLLGHLGTQRVLVVLDNCEHLVDAAAALVDEIVGACPAVTILATSREALQVDGERTYTVPSLDVPAAGETDSMAVQLFADRAEAANAAFALTVDSAAHVAEICRRLDGLPLAIELAAAQSAALSPQQIAERLSDRFRLLTGGRRHVQRQHTLETMLDWSYDLLDEHEQQVLRALAVFPQPFTLEQAEGVVGGAGASTARTLRALVAKSLVSTAADRFRLLETVRLYAEQRLLDAGEAELVRTRHRDFFLAWVLSFDADDTVWTTAFTARFVSEMDHIRAVVRWADAEGDVATIARFAARTFLTGFGDEWGWLQRGAEATDLPDDERLRFLTAASWGALSYSDFPRALAWANEAFALPPDAGGLSHAVCHAVAALCHATVHFVTGAGDVDEARRHIDASAAVAASPIAQTLSGCYRGLAQVALGDFETARTTLRAATTGRPPDGVTALIHALLGVLAGVVEDDEESLTEIETSQRLMAADPLGQDSDYSLMLSAPYGPALTKIGRAQEGVAFMRRLVESRRGRPTAPVLARAVLGCLGLMLAIEEHYEEGVAFMVQPYESPTEPFALIIYPRWLDKARDAIGDVAYERALERGRSLTMADAPRALDLLVSGLDEDRPEPPASHR